MKRPRIFGYVAAWCFVGLLTQASYLTRPMRAYQAAGQPTPTLWSILPLVAVAFVVWQTAGMVQLRRFHRWFAVIFFVWWAIALVWNFVVALGRPTMHLLPAVLVFSTLVVLNLLGAWYLSRRSFREFSVRFAAERAAEKHSLMMQKVSRKKVLDEIGK